MNTGSPTLIVSSPLHGVCARPPVDSGRRALLFFMSHFFAVGERVHAPVITL